MNPSNPDDPGFATEKEARELLVRYQCPTPFHVVRALFMGNIASPRLDVHPLVVLTQIWDGELPVATSKEVEEVSITLLQGLWNRLAEHQKSRNPFRLMRFEVQATRTALRDLAQQRAQELQAFMDGMFGSSGEEIMLDQKAYAAMHDLAELCSMFEGVAELLADESKPAPPRELKELLRHLHKLAIVADELINKTVQSCRRSRSERARSLDTMPLRKSSLWNPGASGLTDLDENEEPEVIESPLCQNVTRHGVSVRVEIYGNSHGGWILEVIDTENASHVWDDPFETEQEALAEALRALDEEPLEFFCGAADRPLS